MTKYIPFEKTENFWLPAVNPSLSGIRFLYPLKTSENHKFSGVIKVYKKRTPKRNGLT